MSEKKPFIIRNDTPHNVEVVAGSLNAKGKKSWVKANDEDHENNKVGEQHLDLDQHLENLLSSEKEAADSSPVITHAIEDSQTSLSKESVNDRNQKLDLGPRKLRKTFNPSLRPAIALHTLRLWMKALSMITLKSCPMVP
jgi:hypothetical protein